MPFFFDVQKAFDRVDPDLLLLKLTRMGVPAVIIA